MDFLLIKGALVRLQTYLRKNADLESSSIISENSTPILDLNVAFAAWTGDSLDVVVTLILYGLNV